MSELTIEQRVAAGVAWLDENRPGWVDRIDLRSLDLSSTCNCILGQEYGHFLDAPTEARYDSDGAPAAYLGFDASFFLGDTYAALTAEWRRVIESRRAES